MANILLIRSDVKLAGPAKLMDAYALTLRSRKHKVFFISGGGSYESELTHQGFEHHTISHLRYGQRTIWGLPEAVGETAKIIKRKKIDIIHSFNAYSGLIANFADLQSKCAHFNTVLGTGKEWSNRFLPGRIIAVSEDVRQKLLRAGVSAKKIDKIYNSTLDGEFFGPRTERLFDSDYDNKQPLTLCNVAMFTGHKGQDRIISLLSKLVHEKELDVDLSLVGEGNGRQHCEELALKLKVSDRVSFDGQQMNVIPFLDQADIFVHLPEFETFGIVLAEAMARGLPVLSYRVGGIPEVVRDGEDGLLLDPKDEKSLLDAAVELITDHEKRIRFSSNAAERAKKFSIKNLGDELECLYYKHCARRA